MLNIVFSFFRLAKSSIESDDLAKAYEKTWQARIYLFRVQENFEKKRKIGSELSSTRF
jgi:hypothetical protein